MRAAYRFTVARTWRALFECWNVWQIRDCCVVLASIARLKSDVTTPGLTVVQPWMDCFMKVFYCSIYLEQHLSSIATTKLKSLAMF